MLRFPSSLTCQVHSPDSVQMWFNRPQSISPSELNQLEIEVAKVLNDVKEMDSDRKDVLEHIALQDDQQDDDDQTILHTTNHLNEESTEQDEDELEEGTEYYSNMNNAALEDDDIFD